jgi:hypothetical protein
MPFTPLHMGPGIAVKAAMRGAFSLVVFGWAQIVMDIQPLLVMLTGEGHLHGFSHTYVGATMLGAVAAVTGKYFGEWGLRFLGLDEECPIGWRVAVPSAAIGTYSHVAIDSIMHADMAPWWPWSSTNALLGWISIDALHTACLALGGCGAVAFFALGGRIRGRK